MLETLTKDIPLSNFLQNKQFRLLNSLRSRQKALKFQYSYFLNNHYKQNLSEIELKLRVSTYNEHQALITGLINRLVNNSLFCNNIYLDVLKKTKIYPKTIEDHSKYLFNMYVPRKMNLSKNLNILKKNLKSAPKDLIPLIEKLIKEEQNFIILAEKLFELLKRNCLKARKAELVSRVILEAMTRSKEDWFIVFNTLTVSNHHFQEVFGANSSAWTDYVRSIDRAIGIRLHGSWRGAIRKRKQGEEFHIYFAVVERGSIGGRPHIHLLHFMKVLPNGCVDPNMGKSIPYYDEIDHLKPFWKFGISEPNPVRLDTSDAYSKLNWRWPVKLNKKTKKYENLVAKSPCCVVNYITKYLTKEFKKPLNRREIRWRTKMSQSLGKTICQKIINRCDQNQLELILRMRSRNVLQIHEKPLPLWMMKKLAMNRILKLNLKPTQPKFWKMIVDLKPLDGIMKRVRSLILGKEICNQLSFGSLRIITLMQQVGSNLLKIVDDISREVFGNFKQTINLSCSTMEVRYG